MQSTQKEVLDAIKRERTYQIKKWGGNSNDTGHTDQTWFRFIQEELLEAKVEHRLLQGVCRQEGPKAEPFIKNMKAELVQAAAVIVAMLQQIGVEEGHDA